MPPTVVDAAGHSRGPENLYPHDKIWASVAMLEQDRPWTETGSPAKTAPRSSFATARNGFASRPEVAHLASRPKTPDVTLLEERPGTPMTTWKETTWISIPATRHHKATGLPGPGAKRSPGTVYDYRMGRDAPAGFGSLSRGDPLSASFSSLRTSASCSSLGSSGSLSRRQQRIEEREAQRGELMQQSFDRPQSPYPGYPGDPRTVFDTRTPSKALHTSSLHTLGSSPGLGGGGGSGSGDGARRVNRGFSDGAPGQSWPKGWGTVSGSDPKSRYSQHFKVDPKSHEPSETAASVGFGTKFHYRT